MYHRGLLQPTDIPQALLFPQVIQTVDYSPSVLEATAALIFGEGPRTMLRPRQSRQVMPNRGLDMGSRAMERTERHHKCTESLA